MTTIWFLLGAVVGCAATLAALNWYGPRAEDRDDDGDSDA